MVKSHSKKLLSNIIALVSMVLLVFVDQLTKFLAVHYLKGNDGIPIIKNVFRLFYLENTGAAFGVFRGKQTILIIVSILAFAVFIYLYEKYPFNKRMRFLRACLTLLAAGALGNMIDRINNNFVVDFFYFELIDFPIFNVADCYVCVAMFFLIILLLFYYKEEDFKR